MTLRSPTAATLAVPAAGAPASRRAIGVGNRSRCHAALRHGLLALAIASLAPGATGTRSAAAQDGGAGPRFVTHVIDGELASGYQPVVTDLNRDGRPDVIGLSTRTEELAWYENPGWERHVLTTGLSRSINAAARDLDGDGIPEIALAHEFGTTHASSLGILSLLTHAGDPTEPWRIREVDRTPTVHRIRWADADGTGRPVLVSAPLSGPAAEPPEYRDAVPVYWYRPDDWRRRTVTNAGQGVVHGLLVKPWRDAPGDAVFTASFAGVHVHRYLDGEWSRETVAAGALDPWPGSGSSEVEVGRLGERDFVATIEPWHGPQVVVYREEAGSWERQVIDEIGSGHTIVTADFDGDGRDEIVTGDRGDTRRLHLYAATDAEGAAWSRQVLDGDMSPSGCAVADLNSDGRIDLVCIGGRTANLKWYENVSP